MFSSAPSELPESLTACLSVPGLPLSKGEEFWEEEVDMKEGGELV